MGIKITLCGSTRFHRAFTEWNARLTLQGHLVYSVAIPVHAWGAHVSADEKNLLDDVHLRKIDASDEILVLDINGYIGDSTRREIAYARQHQKRVRFLSELAPEWDETQCIYAERTVSTGSQALHS